MQVEQLTVKPEEAAKLYRKYKEHQAYQTPIDAEIQRIAGLVSKGKIVVEGVGSVIKAGLHKQLPRLAIARADSKFVIFRPSHPKTGGVMTSHFSNSDRAVRTQTRVFTIPPGSWDTVGTGKWDYKAMAPLIPPDVRPKRGIENYTLLWEVDEWEMVPPIDPILMRRIGNSDMFLVVAQWDLTPIERMVMGSRIGRN